MKHVPDWNFGRGGIVDNAELRRSNKAALLRLVLRTGQSTRQELIDQTRLSKATVSRLVRELVEEGTLIEAARTEGADGRRSTQVLTFQGQLGLVCGIDMGGTTTRFVLADYGCGLVDAWRKPTPTEAGARELAGWIASEIHARATTHPAGEPTVTTVGVPGSVDPRTSAIRNAEHLPGIAGDAFVSELAARLSGGLRVDNDSNLALVGEMSVGEARRASDVVMITIGTGVGAGVALGGTLRTGQHGLVGEIGLLPVDLKGTTFESVVKGAALSAAAFELTGVAERPSSVLEASSDGPLGVIQERVRRSLVNACTALAVLYEPEIIVIGGGLARALKRHLSAVEAAIGRLLRPVPRLATSELGDAAGAVGATALSLQTAYELLGAGRSVVSELGSHPALQVLSKAVSAMYERDQACHMAVGNTFSAGAARS